MIHNIKELQNYMLKDFKWFSEKYPDSNHDDFKLDAPGCSHEHVEFLKKQIPELPESYTKWFKKLNLHGVSIGWFSLSPHPYGTQSFIECFVKANTEPFFPQAFLDRHHMYQIGSRDTDLVYVTTGTDEFKNGEILFVDEGDPFEPEDSQIHPLAENFEQFLLLAGNANQLTRDIKEDDSNREEKEQEFIKRMNTLKIPEKYHRTWLRMI